MNTLTNKNLTSSYERFSNGGDAVEFRRAISEASPEEKQELKTLLTPESSEIGESLPEITSLKKDIAAYQKLKEDIEAGERKLKEFPRDYEEAARKLTELFENNKSNDPGNINLTDRRNLLRGTTFGAKKGSDALLGLLDGLDEVRKKLETDNLNLEKVYSQIRNAVLKLDRSSLNKETMAQIETIAESLNENVSMYSITEMLRNLKTVQVLISYKDLKKEMPMEPDLSVLEKKSVISVPRVEELKIEKPEESNFEVDSGDKIDKALGESGSGFKTEAEATEAADQENNLDKITITDSERDEIDRRNIKKPTIAEFNFVSSPEPKTEASAPTNPVSMVKIEPNGEAKDEAVKTSPDQKVELKSDLNIPNTKKAAGEERIEKIKELISGRKIPVDAASLSDKVSAGASVSAGPSPDGGAPASFELGMRGKRPVSGEKKSAVFKRLEEIRAKEAMANSETPDIETELLKDVPKTVEGVESASIETSTAKNESGGKILTENISGEKTVAQKPDGGGTAVANQPILAEQPTKTAVQEQINKPIEQEKRGSIFGRVSKLIKGLGKNPDSSGAAKLVEIQKANKEELERN